MGISPDRTELHRYLESQGYLVVFESRAWVQCLVLHGSERWHGTGLDQLAALDDAVSKMVPSTLGRRLLDAAVGSAPATSSGSGSDGGGSKSISTPTAVNAHPDSPPVGSKIDLPQTGTEVKRIELPKVVKLSRPSGAERQKLLAEARGRLERLLQEVRSCETDIASMSPELIQLTLLGWIAKARGEQERLNEKEVEHMVRDIAASSSAYSKLYWPGNVPALRLDAWPESTADILGSRNEPPRSWSDVAVLADQRVEEMLDSGGIDECGWTDWECLHPRSKSPNLLLSQAKTSVEALLGPAGQRPTRDDDQLIQDLTASDIAQLERRTKHMRWIRGAVDDELLWGRLIGRLRWASFRLGSRGESLRQLLEPRTRPEQSWADEILGGQQDEHRENARRGLVERRPWVQKKDAESGAIVEWVVNAFDAFDTAELAGLIQGNRDAEGAVEAMTVDMLDGLARGQRRRFRRLRESLARGEGKGVMVEKAADVPAEMALEVDAKAERLVPGSTLIERARRAVAGKHVVFVSNRTDPKIRKQLEDSFDLQLDWVELSTSEVKSAVERIRDKKYEVVIAATGFLNHGDDGELGPAARAAGVPYVRAHRGRPLATARAILRDMT